MRERDRARKPAAPAVRSHHRKPAAERKPAAAQRSPRRAAVKPRPLTRAAQRSSSRKAPAVVEVDEEEDEEEEGEQDARASEEEGSNDEEEDGSSEEPNDDDSEEDEEEAQDDDDDDEEEEDDDDDDQEEEEEEEEDVPVVVATRTRTLRGNTATSSTPPRSSRSSGASAAASAPPADKRRRADAFALGSEILCKWLGDNEEHEARILQMRKTDSGQTEYYVRYSGFDHRLDEWVPASRLRPVKSAAATSSPRDNEPRRRKARDEALKQISMSAAAAAAAAAASSGSGGHAGESEEDLHQVKNIHTITLGRYEMDTWYYSPYPDEYCQEGKLYICEFCLKYLKKKHTLERHAEKCEARHPPGDEIYRDGELSVFEVDGKKHRIYCQNLCLLSKLFLDHKTLYYDVDPFFFYILTECDSKGAHICGYFSKEKVSPDNYNLACILTLPPYQRKGYGSFLISLSYELSKREGICGSPEKPLSDLGRLGYHSYWSRIVLDLLRKNKNTELSIKDISKMTSITPADIVETLRGLNMVRFWKGSHVLVVSQKLVDSFLDSVAGKRFRVINPVKLNWQPRKATRDIVTSQF